jgi:hypothetical protein
MVFKVQNHYVYELALLGRFSTHACAKKPPQPKPHVRGQDSRIYPGLAQTISPEPHLAFLQPLLEFNSCKPANGKKARNSHQARTITSGCAVCMMDTVHRKLCFKGLGLPAGANVAIMRHTLEQQQQQRKIVVGCRMQTS